ncbi:MAG: transketolase [Acidobacteria bacterium]|nr:MAG: transketolase [Acidobacteriota bacterium]
MSYRPDDLDLLAVNTIRGLAIDAIEKARSGHPGLPLGAAPMAYVLWQRHLRFDPSDPEWPDRDRFVLSAGHGSMLLYALLHLYGFDLPLEELERFRQWGSRTPGHPERHLTPGVEATTGPLGQGTAVAAGMAVAEAMLRARFGPALVGHRTYALVSDGDLMEGISSEAASLAGHLRLGRLIYLYDSNGISLDGPTSMTFTEDVSARYRAYGWQVLEVADGDGDLAAIDRAITEAEEDEERPSLIVVHTTIGFGSPHKAGTHAAHGSPLGEEEARLTKAALGLDPDRRFAVPDEVRSRCAEAAERGRRAHAAWRERLERSERREEFRRFLEQPAPVELAERLPRWRVGESLATRAAAGKALQAVAAALPWLVGGDADLSGSTKTEIAGAGWVAPGEWEGRNVHFGVREHAMGAIANGLAYHGGLRPFVATFLAFSDYMRPPVRLAALDRLPVVYVWTHDSIGVGEDGPTHQPVEQIAALRAIPGLHVVRPGDPNEAAAAWLYAARRTDGPTALVLSRQKLPVLEGTLERASQGLPRGAYVLAEAEGGTPDAIVIATGSELQLALAARTSLAAEGIRVRVVSMPCAEAFEEQEDAYRKEVLPPAVTARVVIEAGRSLGWHRWAGDRGVVIGVDRFGASAPGPVVMEKLGITEKAVVESVRSLVAGARG